MRSRNLQLNLVRLAHAIVRTLDSSICSVTNSSIFFLSTRPRIKVVNLPKSKLY